MTMRGWLLAAGFVGLCANMSAAQTVERSYDLTAAGWGPVTITPIDADGDPATEEWAVRQPATLVDGQFVEAWRVVAIRGRLCVGEWFRVPGLVDRGQVSIHMIGRRSKLLVSRVAFSWTGLQYAADVIALDMPPCQ